jgi:purine-binding chemotaxis protein CheW
MSLPAASSGPTTSGGSAPTNLREFLAFKLGAEEYGIDILRVQEIRSYEVPTRIANAPAFIKGVVNLRGVIVPIIDMPATTTSPSSSCSTSQAAWWVSWSTPSAT